MKLLLVALCVLWEASAYPYYPYYYGNSMDSMSYGASDTHGAMVLSRLYQPYYPRMNAGMAAFMFQPQAQGQAQNQAYYVPDRRRQTLPDSYFPQQNEVYPQAPEVIPTPKVEADFTTTEKVYFTTEKSTPELIDTTDKSVPELVEPEVEDVEIEKPKRRVSKKKQVKKPVEDEEEEEDFMPKMPGGVMFPMFFGWGGRSGGAEPGGPIAVANAYSTARGGVASSHATAYGAPRPETRYAKGL